MSGYQLLNNDDDNGGSFSSGSKSTKKKTSMSNEAGKSGGKKGEKVDPFNIVKQRVTKKAAKVQKSFDRWKTVLENENTANNTEFTDLSKSLKIDLKDCNVDVQDLSNVIKVIDEKRQIFKHISDEELDSRRNFVNEKAQFLHEIETTMSSDRSKSKIEKDANNSKKAGAGRPKDAFARANSSRQDDAISSARDRERAMVEEQDEVLRDMSSAMDRLELIATDININLKEKEVVLEEMDIEFDLANDQFSVTLDKIDKLLASSNNGRMCCIFLLVVTSFILLFVIVYT